MKKIAAFSISVLTLVAAYAPKAYAQFSGDWFRFLPAGFATGDLTTTIGTIINLALLLAGVVAVVYLIIGGYQYITSGGNAEQAQAGRTTVLNAIIGLVIIFASYVIVNFVLSRITTYRPSL